MSASGAMSEHEYRENKFFSIFGSVPEPSFESVHEQTAVWGRRWGCNTDVGRLRVVLMHRPGEELSVVKNQPMPEIGGFGDPEKGWYWMGQIYTRDSVVGVPGGAIVTRLARRVRRGEELPVTRALANAGCPILATIHGSAVFEGGGFAFLDAKTAVCSESIACNGEGVRQIEAVLSGLGVTLIKVPMPGYRIHIDGSFMMIDVDTAIVNVNELPYFFIDYLKRRGMRLIELPPDDSPMSLNCLAIAPGRVVMRGNRSPRLADRLDAAGITVLTCSYDAVELGGGGIHCSTAPLVRDPV
jgi:N-dimethylarginine dimethylaminohydrolase